MRFYCLLIVAAAMLVASGATVSATSDADQTTLSKVASPEAAEVHSLDVNKKRLLRSNDEEDVKVEDEDEDEDEDEERAFQPSAAQLEKWTAKVNRWVKKGHSPANRKDKLTDLNGYMSDKNRWKYNLFTAAWGRANPHALG